VVSVAFLLAMPVLAGRYGLTGAGAGLVGASTALAVGMLLFILRENGNRRPSAPSATVPDDRLKGEA
jgi:O-antigen/teichoic acid export membrane protein